MKKINKVIQIILISVLSINLIFIIRGIYGNPQTTGGEIYNPIAYIFIILSILELIYVILMTKKNQKLIKQIIIIFILIIQFTIMWNVKVIIVDYHDSSSDLQPAVLPNYYNIYGNNFEYK